MTSECQQAPGLVEVQPFCHQVGGHNCVLQVNEKIICKQFVQNEVTFYTCEPEELKEFTPKYLGETEVFYHVTGDQKHLLATIPPELLLQEGLSFIEPVDDVTDVNDVTTQTAKRGRKRSRSCEPDDSGVALKRGCSSVLAVWSRSCIERQINRHGFWANNRPQKFIMMENLVYNYRHPCLMDLKMGRRQFGNDSSAEKRKLLTERCAVTTSATLGYRINGSQVYKCSDSQYVFHDKYFGRELDDQGALGELCHFFHSGYHLREDVIIEIIQKLDRLESYLCQQQTFNFFSCSLLLIYDASYESNGASEHTQVLPETGTGSGSDAAIRNEVDARNEANNDISRKQTPKVDVRLIDFAHVCKRTEEENVEGRGDETIVFGLTKLRDGLKKLVNFV